MPNATRVAMETDAGDRRRKVVKLTMACRTVPDHLAIPAEQARQRLLSAFSPCPAGRRAYALAALTKSTRRFKEWTERAKRRSVR
jgi:hypothetical protein